MPTIWELRQTLNKINRERPMLLTILEPCLVNSWHSTILPSLFPSPFKGQKLL